MPGVAYAEVVGNIDKDSITYLVESQPGIDIRKPLFNMLSSRGWPMIGIEALGANLEDVFIAIVDKQDSPQKNIRTKGGK